MRDADKMLGEMTKCIWRLPEEILRVSKGESRRMKGARWWSGKVKEKVKAKQEVYTAPASSGSDEEKRLIKCGT